MKYYNFLHVILSVCISLIASSSALGAEVYKWVDQSGRTHYSENKKEAEAAGATTLEIKASPPLNDSIKSPSRDQKTPLKPYQQKSPNRQPIRLPVAEKPKSPSETNADETDAAKCNLARAILNGSARHSNMKPTDAYDRQVAESDIGIFCKK
jgi:hypothetical protein